jgi:hypothetical protein
LLGPVEDDEEALAVLEEELPQKYQMRKQIIAKIMMLTASIFLLLAET